MDARRETGNICVNTHNGTFENVTNVEKVNREKEINVIRWKDSTQSQIFIGRRELSVDVYDIEQKQITSTYDVSSGTGPLKGLGYFNEKLVTCSHSGHVRISDLNSEDKHEVFVGENVLCMRQNPTNPSLIATGGKENLLKVWDLNTSKSIFKAKNVPNNWLDIRIPIWVTDIQYLNGGDKIITSTGTHTVRLYDTKTRQRKPIFEISYDEYPLTSLAIPNDENYVIVGNTKGYMALLDLRKKAMVHCYKGFAGSVRSIACHPTKEIMASCGLDRFLLIHEIHSRKLLNKLSLLLPPWLECSRHSRHAEKLEEIESNPTTENIEPEKIEENDDKDELWNSLKPVNISRKRKKKLDPNIDLKDRLWDSPQMHTSVKKKSVAICFGSSPRLTGHPSGPWIPYPVSHRSSSSSPSITALAIPPPHTTCPKPFVEEYCEWCSGKGRGQCA
ncbi:WD repeat-containing protein 74 [Nymphon striatum]|nr:WD repeat-containing protein 74 [Nymphon striatum]